MYCMQMSDLKLNAQLPVNIKTRLSIIKGYAGKHTQDSKAMAVYCTSALEGSN